MAKTYLFWEPLSDNIVQEIDETAGVTAEYTAEPGLYGNLISQNRGGVERQLQYDVLGSTLAVSDNNQQVIDNRAYSAFGEATESTGSTDFPFQYIGRQGYYRDDVTTQLVLRRRVYQPMYVRWHSLDPVSQCHVAGSVAQPTQAACHSADPIDSPTSRAHSAYSYVWNSPLRAVDPSGTIPIFEDPRPFPGPRRPAPPKKFGSLPRCPSGFWLTQRRGFVPRTNGCSVPPQFRRIPFFNKDAPIAGISFLAACDAHDVCYDTCGGSKETCDIDFYDAMIRACEAGATPAVLQSCKEVAEAYYGAVRDFGFGPDGWDGTQAEACECCRPCNPDLCIPPAGVPW